MSTCETVSYWKPSLSEADRQHLESLQLESVTVKGNPYTGHLKKPGEWPALCGKAPGEARKTKRMADRTGWLRYSNLEGPGRTLCEACLKAAEHLAAASTRADNQTKD